MIQLIKPSFVFYTIVKDEEDAATGWVTVRLFTSTLEFFTALISLRCNNMYADLLKSLAETLLREIFTVICPTHKEQAIN